LLKILLLILLASIVLNAILIFAIRKKKKEFKKIKNIYTQLHGNPGIENILNTVTDELRKMGVEVLGFLRKTPTALVSEKCSIPADEKSTAAQALFTLTPRNISNTSPHSKTLKDSFGAEISVIPAQAKEAGTCYEITGCGDKGCKCFYKKDCRCWIDSGKRFRGKDLPTYKEKTRKCLACNAFLPVGLFVTSGGKITKAYNFINDNFSGFIKDSLSLEKAVYTATVDHLTGISNRRGLMEALSMMFKIADRHSYSLSLCMFDIDHFKRFNDSYGHPVGDLILRGLAQVVKASIRETDLIGRYGGEEFTIVFPATSKEEAETTAEKIRKKVGGYKFKTDKGDLSITISMGIAAFPVDDIESVDFLIKKADKALYQAKKTRDKVVAFKKSF